LLRHPLTIEKPTALRVRAFKPGSAASPIASASYIVDEAIGGVPAVSLVLDPVYLYEKHAGIYVNPEMHGRAWERPAEVAVLRRTGNILDPIGARVRIHGGASRKKPLKSFRVYFERNNADVLEWLVGETDHEDAPRTWVLRFTSNNEQFLADRFIQKVARRLGLMAPIMKPCLLYVNGSFWGVYDFAQRLDESTIKLFEKTKLDVVLLHGAPLAFPPVDAPNDGGWHDLYRYIAENDMTDPLEFERVARAIDLDNLIHYFALSIFMADGDRPQNNLDVYRLIGSQDQAGSKWKFASWDFDGGLNYRGAFVEHDTLAWHLRSQPRPDLKDFGAADNARMLSSTTFLRALLQNEDFRKRFYTRFTELLHSELSSTSLQSMLRELLVEYAEVLPLERRKFDQDPKSDFDRRMHDIEKFIAERPAVMARLLARAGYSRSE
jgi:hypothetical protein